jgi:pimeloyl-ACP methyl ester carboxylesterase
VVEFFKNIPPLTDPTAHGGQGQDAFHVVAPSLPGFGFSDKPAERGWNADRIARAWTELMRRLGYDRYVAQGGDWGCAGQGLDADYREARRGQAVAQPGRQRPCLDAGPFEVQSGRNQERSNGFGLARRPAFAHDPTLLVDDADRRLFHRDVKADILLHGCPPSLLMLAWGGFPTPYKPAWRAAARPSRRSEPAARLRHLSVIFQKVSITFHLMD